MKKEMLLICNATPRMMERLEKSFIVHKLAELDNPLSFLEENGERIMAVATNGHDGVKPEYMSKLPNLKIISCFGVGYDAIDAEACAENEIVVTHTPNVLNKDVANAAILLMLSVSRRLIHDYNWITSGKWKSVGNAPLTTSIEAKKVGIVGLGRIGEAIAKKLAAGFDCDVSYHTRNEKPDMPWRYYGDLKQMASDVDYLVVITPGGPATDKLINREVMEALGPEGTLINVARGTVVDEAEMVKALKDGRLGNAGLDVFEREPHVPEELFNMDNVVLLPHSASATVETRQAMGDLTVENLERFVNDGTVVSPVPECAAIART